MMGDQETTTISDEKQDAQEQTTVSQVPEDSSSSEQETKQPETAETPDEPKRKKKYVPLEELVRERQRRRDLESELRAEIERVKTSVDAKADPVKELMSDFNVDEETAKKLHKHGLGQRGQQPSGGDEIQRLTNNFQRQAEDISQDYDDWDDLRDEMAKVLNKEYLRNPAAALSKSPEVYYLQAKRLRSQEEKEASVSEVINKSNSKNLASVESGKNSSSRPNAKPQKGTRAWLKGLSQEDFVKHHDYINSELARGGFKE